MNASRAFATLLVALVLASCRRKEEDDTSSKPTPPPPVACNGPQGACPCAGEAVSRSTLPQLAEYLVARDDGLYASVSMSGTVAARYYRIPWSGGDPSLVVDASAIHSVSTVDPPVISNDELFFMVDDAIYRAEVGTLSAPKKIVTKLRLPRFLAANRDWLVFVNGDWLHPGTAPDYTTAVTIAPRKGGAAKELFRAAVRGLVVDERYAYVAATDQGIVRIELATGERKTLSPVSTGRIWLVNGGLAYEAKDIERIGLEGGTPTKLMPSPPWSLGDPAFDGKALVYLHSATSSTDVAKGNHKIYYDGALLVRRGTSVCTLATSLAELKARIALHGDEVWWTFGSEIKSQRLQ